MCCFRPHLSGRRPLHEFNQFEVHNVQPEWLPLRNAIAQCTMPDMSGRFPLHVYNQCDGKIRTILRIHTRNCTVVTLTQTRKKIIQHTFTRLHTA